MRLKSTLTGRVALLVLPVGICLLNLTWNVRRVPSLEQVPSVQEEDRLALLFRAARYCWRRTVSRAVAAARPASLILLLQVVD